jgi:glutamate dehydrogenase
MPQNIAIKQTNNKQEFRANLIDSIVSKAQKMSKDKIFYDFILAFFSTTSENTLEILNQEKLLEVANQTYLFSKTKTANDTIKIRVYNSDKDFFFDRTIIEICTNDSPFIVNSLLSALSNNNYKVYEIFHPVIKIERNAKGEINKIYDFKNSSEDLPRESIVQLHISRVNSLDEQEKIAKLVKTALNFVKISIEDWKPIVHRAETILKNINGEDRLEVEEAKEFIKWLLHENFVFLGYVKYDVRQEDKKKELVIDEKSRLLTRLHL